MSNEEEEQRIASNLDVIHTYLTRQFPGFDVPPGKSNPSMYHTFTVTNLTTHTSYILRVTWPRLSDRSNTPEKIELWLLRDHVADGMRATENGGYFSW
jgi:hypothetical protein